MPPSTPTPTPTSRQFARRGLCTTRAHALNAPVGAPITTSPQGQRQMQPFRGKEEGSGVSKPASATQMRGLEKRCLRLNDF